MTNTEAKGKMTVPGSCTLLLFARHEETVVIGEAQDVLLYRERQAYLRAVGVAGLEEVRVALARARQRAEGKAA